MMNKWQDISIPLSPMLPAWPGDQPFRRDRVSVLGVDGAHANVSLLTLGSHFGTHVDAPLHFIEGGIAVDELDVQTLVGPAYVLDLSELTDNIAASDLIAQVPKGVERLLVRTSNSQLHGDGVFHTDFIGFTVGAIEYVLGRGVKLLGIDYYSIAPYRASTPVHQAFLGATGAIALETINLKDIEQGWYDLICLPLRIEGCDGAPARALLRRREEVG